MSSWFGGSKKDANVEYDETVDMQAPPEEVHETMDSSIEVHMPTEFRIEQIFEYMKEFDLKKNLAPTIEYSLTKYDQALENNIRYLFGGNIPNLDKIKILEAAKLQTIFKKSVKPYEQLLHPVKRQLLEDKNKISKDDTTLLEYFYPNLIRLMIAVMAQVQKTQFKGTIMHKNNQASSMVFQTWKHVLSQLNELLNVIIYLNQENDGFLGDYPTQWLQLVHERTREIHSLNFNIHRLNDDINKMEYEINQRDKHIQEIESKYSATVDELEVANSRRQNLEERLSQLLDVDIMVRDNMIHLRDVQAIDKQNKVLLQQKTQASSSVNLISGPPPNTSSPFFWSPVHAFHYQ